MGRLSRYVVSAGLVVLAATVALVAPAARLGSTAPAYSTSTAWPMNGGDPSHQGVSSHNGPSTADLAWTFNLTAFAHYVTISPVVGPDGTIYVPVVASAGGAQTGLWAVNPNGTFKWRVGDAPRAASAAVAPDGTVYFADLVLGPFEIRIRALNPANGSEIWHYPVNVSFSGPTVGADGAIYVGGVNANQLVAIEANGSERWTLDMPNGCGVPVSPAIGPNGDVYVARYCSSVIAVTSGGTQRWSVGGLGFYGNNAPPTGVAVGPDGTIYTSSPLAALNPDGTFRWQQPYSNDVVFPSLSADGSLIYYACSAYTAATLCAFDKQGFLRWSFGTGRDGWLSGTVSAANGIVYVSQEQGTDGHGYLYALRQTDGALLWSHDTGGSESTPAIGPDGTVYALGWGPTSQLTLYAFRPTVTAVGAAPTADLSILNRRVAGQGGDSVFEMVVTNVGGTTATGVEVRNQIWRRAFGVYRFVNLESGCVEGRSMGGFADLLNGVDLICSVGTLAPGASKSIVATSFSSNSAEPLQSRAGARARQAELTPTNNVALATSADPLTPIERQVSVTLAGAGTGAVSGSPVGITCSATCTMTYAFGTYVVLTASPAPGSTFAGWSGACTGTATCVLAMNQARSVTATFQRLNAGVQVTRPAGGPAPGTLPTLTVTLSARQTCGPFQQIQFGAAGQAFANARVTVTAPAGGPANQTAGFVYTPPAGTPSVALTIQRVVQAGGATVSPILLLDGCGEWRTFVGGGPDAFR